MSSERVHDFNIAKLAAVFYLAHLISARRSQSLCYVSRIMFCNRWQTAEICCYSKCLLIRLTNIWHFCLNLPKLQLYKALQFVFLTETSTLTLT